MARFSGLLRGRASLSLDDDGLMVDALPADTHVLFGVVESKESEESGESEELQEFEGEQRLAAETRVARMTRPLGAGDLQHCWCIAIYDI